VPVAGPLFRCMYQSFLYPFLPSRPSLSRACPLEARQSAFSCGPLFHFSIREVLHPLAVIDNLLAFPFFLNLTPLVFFPASLSFNHEYFVAKVQPYDYRYFPLFVYPPRRTSFPFRSESRTSIPPALVPSYLFTLFQFPLLIFPHPLSPPFPFRMSSTHRKP